MAGNNNKHMLIDDMSAELVLEDEIDVGRSATTRRPTDPENRCASQQQQEGSLMDILSNTCGTVNRESEKQPTTPLPTSEHHMNQIMSPDMDLRTALPFVSVKEFLANKPVEIPWLVQNIWPSEGCGFIAGPPKTYKSFLALDLALAVSSGNSFLGESVDQGPVLFFDAENLPNQLQTRIQMLAKGRRLENDDLQNLMILPPQGIKLDEKTNWDRMRHSIKDFGPKLVVIDPMVRVHSLEENSANDMSRFLQGIRDLVQDTNSALILVHHMLKSNQSPGGQSLRGSGDLFGWYDAAMYVNQNKNISTVTFENRYDAPHESIKPKLVFESDRAYWDIGENSSGLSSAEERIIDLLHANPDGYRSIEFRDLANMSGSTVKKALEHLIEIGRIKKIDAKTAGRRSSVYQVVLDTSK